MLGITQRDIKRTVCIREKTRLTYIIQVVKLQKWRQAGHVARMNDNRWTKRITDRLLYNDKCSKKRPDTRWRGEIEKFTSLTWQRIAQNRQLWNELG